MLVSLFSGRSAHYQDYLDTVMQVSRWFCAPGVAVISYSSWLQRIWEV